MEIKEAITSFRKQQNLTQDELAEQLFLTRQAISRWETGETTPGADTLKLISKKFGVSIDQLLGTAPTCQSCAMTLHAPEDFGTEADGGITAEYCSHCYQNGSFSQERTIEEMVESNLRFLDEFNAVQGTSYTEEEARTVLLSHLASLKRWN